jgi:uncharacterized RDD family membrane protein YckC
MMSETLKSNKSDRQCPVCHSDLPADLPPDFCPKCLLQAGLGTQVIGSKAEPLPRSLSTKQLKGLPQAGEQFGHYQIVRLLGQGGMGVVYEAEDLDDGRRLALKILSAALDSVEARTRFLREGQLAASINHPHSVYVFGTEEIAGTPVIAMELMGGGTLWDKVVHDGPMPTTAAVDALLQIIAGLEAAARVGLLHRDVKPSNCFIDSDGTVKIGDFGLSIDTNVRTELDSLGCGGLFGTPAFCSPEQLRGDMLSAQSDIYSVGVTLNYLLTGRMPFESSNVGELLRMVESGQPDSPRQRRREIPRGLSRVILRCLKKAPNERFADYASLRAALLPYTSCATTPATLGARFVAGCIDVVMLGSIAFVASGDQTKQDWQTTSIFWGIFVAYFTLLEGLAGASAGKVIFGLRVTRNDGRPPGLPRVFWRSVVFIGLVLFGTDMIALLLFGDVSNSKDASLGFIAMAITFGLMALVFSTARKRNGFGGWHDLLSKTRVVAKSAERIRPSSPSRMENWTSVATGSQVGPYQVIGALGGIEVGYDPRLLRKVWIRRLPPGTPAVAPALRGLARPTRLRWLNGRRSGTEAWDAYEATAGRPFLDLLSTKQTWASARFWLFDLAVELQTAAREGSGPGTLSLEQIWITDQGYAKLLDFSAPGIVEAPRRNSLPPTPREFLCQVALSALEGRVLDADAPLTLPIAVHGRDFVTSLKENPVGAHIAARLEPLLRKPAFVSRTRRLGLLGCALFFPILFTVFALVVFPEHNVGLLRERLGPLLLVWAYGGYVVIAPGLLAALLFRGGPLWRAFGVAIVRRDGRPASRLRILWRNFLAFLPFLVLPPVARIFGLHARLEWLMIALLALLGALALFSTLLPGRSLQDRLAGTWLVPR